MTSGTFNFFLMNPGVDKETNEIELHYQPRIEILSSESECDRTCAA